MKTKIKEEGHKKIQGDEYRFPAWARFLLIPGLQSFYVVFHSVWFLNQWKNSRSDAIREDEADKIKLMMAHNNPVLLLALSESLLFSFLFTPEAFINFSTSWVATWTCGLWQLLNSQSHFLQ